MADHREMARSALEAFTTGKLDVLDRVIAADCIVHDSQNPFAADHRGPEVARGQVTMYRGVFPDLVMTVEDQYEDGNAVVSRWTATGTRTAICRCCRRPASTSPSRAS
jgi:SnoaL-like polyketide cyclase